MATQNPPGSSDPRDLVANAGALDRAVNADEDTFQDRLGKTRLTLKGMASAAGDATLAIQAAQDAINARDTVQVNAEQVAQDAAEQASAGVALAIEGKVTEAEAAKNQAALEAVRAEAARDAAFVNAAVFPTLSDGYTSTPVGGQFQVVSSDGLSITRYAKTGGGPAEVVARYPSAQAVEDATNVALNGLLYASTSAVAVDTVAKTITIGTRALVSGAAVYQANVPVVLDYSSPSAPALYLTYMPGSEGGFSLVPTADLSSIEPRTLVLARINTLTGELHGLPVGYTYNGVAVPAGLPAVTPVAVPLIRTAADIDFRFLTNEIVVASNITVPYGNYRILVTPQTLDITSVAAPTWGLIMADPTSGQLSIRPTSALTEDYRPVIGAILKNERQVVGFHSYSIDGTPNTETGEETSEETGSDGKFDNLIGGWDYSGVFNSPAMPNYSTSGGSPVWYDITAAMVVSWYDELVSEYPDYVTKSLLGTDSSGIDIFEYRFSPKTAVTPASLPGRPVKVMMQSAVHGSEKVSIINLYHFMRLICENWQTDPVLSAFRHSVEFCIIPTVVPWAIDNTSRTNSNGVNVNRNYPGNWVPSDPEDDYNYGGPSPLSEPETQISYGVMQSYNPDIFFDCHNFSGTAEGRFIWMPTITDFNRSAGVATINRLAVKWKAEYEWMPDASNLGYTTLSAGGSAGVAAAMIGLLGSTFETADRLHLEPGGPVVGSTLTIRCGVEVIGNMLLIMLRKIAS